MRSIHLGRLAAEFIVIVVGVLAALGVDEWRDNHTARVAEVRFVDGLILDLMRDSSNMAVQMQRGTDKAAALTKVIGRLADRDAVRRNPNMVWPDLGLTYARPDLQTTTFDEMEGTGGLGQIRDGQLRFEIGYHYTDALHQFGRLDQRRTTLAWVAADLFPFVAWGGTTNTDLTAAAFDSLFFAAPNSEQRLQRMLGPEYQGLLNQERIYANSIEDISGYILDATLELLSSLRAYRTTIG